MKILTLILTLSVAGITTRQRAPISAVEVTLRHKIYADGRVAIFLLDIPPCQATLLHRHDRDVLSVLVNGGRTRASFNGAALAEDTFMPGVIHARKSGEIEPVAAGPARRWTNASDPAHVVVVTF